MWSPVACDSNAVPERTTRPELARSGRFGAGRVTQDVPVIREFDRSNTCVQVVIALHFPRRSADWRIHARRKPRSLHPRPVLAALSGHTSAKIRLASRGRQSTTDRLGRSKASLRDSLSRGLEGASPARSSGRANASANSIPTPYFRPPGVCGRAAP